MDIETLYCADFEQEPTKTRLFSNVERHVFVLVIENGVFFPLLDYSAEPSGQRLPIKSFPDRKAAETFATIEGHGFFVVLNL